MTHCFRQMKMMKLQRAELKDVHEIKLKSDAAG